MSGFAVDTPRLRLRVLAAEDVAAFVAYRVHPDVHPWQSWGPDYSTADAEALVADVAAAEPGTPGRWCQVAVVTEDGGLVGDVAFCVHAGDPARASIGYTIDPAHQGRGYATEAVSALLAWLGERGVTEVEADALAGNAASRRVLDRLGFEAVTELDDGGILHRRRLERRPRNDAGRAAAAARRPPPRQNRA